MGIFKFLAMMRVNKGMKERQRYFQLLDNSGK